ncbi:MAG: dihydrodipicolinate synthase family protein, partial [Pseudomonadota bacterium]
MAVDHQAWTGIYPIAPTPFKEGGALDIEGQKRVLDCMVDQGVDGICILANYSEQFVLSDDERATLLDVCTEHVAGRVPIIVTCSHYSTDIAIARAKVCEAAGAKMIMLMPPYHGALLKPDEQGIFEHFQRIAAAIDIPIMVQDAPLAGVHLSVSFLVRMAREIPQVSYFKIEMPGTAAKLRALIAAGDDAIVGPFDGEEGITLLADLQAGATGTMTSALIPELIKPIVTRYLAGETDAAAASYANVLPVINFENRQCGLRATKEAMVEGGVIDSAFVRHPQVALGTPTRRE